MITAAVKPADAVTSIVEEDIFLLFRPAPTGLAACTCAAHAGATTAARTSAGADVLRRIRSPIALRFVQQPQPFHEQALRIELRGFLIGLALKVEFEIPARPAQNLEDGLIATHPRR